MSRHRLFDPDGLPAATGFSYGAVAASGRHVYLAGLTGHMADGSITEDLVEQFGQACLSVGRVIEEAGGSVSDLVSMTIYTTVVDEYRNRRRDLGVAYRNVFGKHYPPMALLGIHELFDPKAKVELVCVAVVPD